MKLTQLDITRLQERAEHRVVDLGMGGCETWVNGDDIVLSRETVIELCRLALQTVRAKR